MRILAAYVRLTAKLVVMRRPCYCGNRRKFFDATTRSYIVVHSTRLFSRSCACFLLAVWLPASVLADDCTSKSDWPQFRGRNAVGISDDHHLPVTWNVEAGTNIKWKTAIPGLGHASPI